MTMVALILMNKNKLVISAVIIDL